MRIEEVIPVFQPIRGLQHADSAWEMLARLPDGAGLVSAFPLIEQLERRGDCYLLDQLQLQRAIEHLARYPDTRLFLNIFPSSLLHGATWDLFADRLSLLDDPSRLVIELTERDPGLLEAAPFARLLADNYGVRIALDDFGSGSSGMAALLGTPFDFVKIDAHFYRQLISDDGQAACFIAKMNELCKYRASEVRTILEGVESAEWLPRIHTLGIDYVQGFAVGRPGCVPVSPAPSEADRLIAELVGTSPSSFLGAFPFPFSVR